MTIKEVTNKIEFPFEGIYNPEFEDIWETKVSKINIASWNHVFQLFEVNDKDVIIDFNYVWHHHKNVTDLLVGTSADMFTFREQEKLTVDDIFSGKVSQQVVKMAKEIKSKEKIKVLGEMLSIKYVARVED